MEAASAEPVAGPSTAPASSSPPPQTVLNTLHTLLSAQNVSQAHLHPCAPAPGKGKARAASREEQLASVRSLKESLEGAKTVLGGRDAGDWGRLSRALREVTTHQSALFPTSTSLLPANLSPVDLPSPTALRIPIDMLKSVASDLGIQTYLEDSQFGLLKTSLTLAGNRFVVDIDLETDSAGADVDGDEVEDAPESTERGKVRLSKLAANHVTKEGGTGKSDWIGVVLRSVLERYLGEWNSSVEGLVALSKRAMRLEGAVRDVGEALEMLKWLDDIAVGERDVYAELETVAKVLQQLESPILQAPCLFPAFHLLPSSTYNPRFLLRPARPGESVPSIIADSGDIPKGWIIQYVSPGDGLPVRRTWLSDETSETNWNGALKMENMLYAEGSIPQTFPYSTEFLHGSGLKQHWTMAQPGPDLFVVGRVGLPTSKDGVETTLNALRRQIILNALWLEVFNPSNAVTSEDDNEDLDDILSAAPTDVPVSLTADTAGLTISFPWSDGKITLVTLRIRPTDSAPFYSAEIVGGGVPGSQRLEAPGLVALLDLVFTQL